MKSEGLSEDLKVELTTRAQRELQDRKVKGMKDEFARWRAVTRCL
jgi:hypothetical protein